MLLSPQSLNTVEALVSGTVLCFVRTTSTHFLTITMCFINTSFHSVFKKKEHSVAYEYNFSFLISIIIIITTINWPLSLITPLYLQSLVLLLSLYQTAWHSSHKTTHMRNTTAPGLPPPLFLFPTSVHPPLLSFLSSLPTRQRQSFL